MFFYDRMAYFGLIWPILITCLPILGQYLKSEMFLKGGCSEISRWVFDSWKTNTEKKRVPDTFLLDILVLKVP